MPAALCAVRHDGWATNGSAQTTALLAQCRIQVRRFRQNPCGFIMNVHKHQFLMAGASQRCRPLGSRESVCRLSRVQRASTSGVLAHGIYSCQNESILSEIVNLRAGFSMTPETARRPPCAPTRKLVLSH